MTRPRTSWARWLVELYLDLRNGFVAARRQREAIEAARLIEAALIERRPTVTRVGPALIPHPGGFTMPVGWSFHADEYWVGKNATNLVGPEIWMDGKVRAFGYTQKELEEIYARRVEFNIDA